MSKKVFLSLVALAGMLPTILVVCATAGQPIRFNHKEHVEDVGLSCQDCHLYVKTQPFAGLPGLDLCLTCHEEPQTDSAEEEKLRALQSEGQELVWQRIYRVPNHVYFSHRRHTTIAEMECTTCHGQIAEMKSPPAKPAISISMGRCIKCHRQENVSNDCLNCHR